MYKRYISLSIDVLLIILNIYDMNDIMIKKNILYLFNKSIENDEKFKY